MDLWDVEEEDELELLDDAEVDEEEDDPVLSSESLPPPSLPEDLMSRPGSVFWKEEQE